MNMLADYELFAARFACAQWHSGQWSGLHSFLSSGYIHPARAGEIAVESEATARECRSRAYGWEVDAYELLAQAEIFEKLAAEARQILEGGNAHVLGA